MEEACRKEGILVGYGALIKAYDSKMPITDKLFMISEKHKLYNISSG